MKIDDNDVVLMESLRKNYRRYRSEFIKTAKVCDADSMQTFQAFLASDIAAMTFVTIEKKEKTNVYNIRQVRVFSDKCKPFTVIGNTDLLSGMSQPNTYFVEIYNNCPISSAPITITAFYIRHDRVIKYFY